MPWILFSSINVATVSQSNHQIGANVSQFSVGTTQTLAQVAGNSAVIRQR